MNLALAYESHPDNITPAVMGGFNVATVRDNEVKYIKKDMPSNLNAVVVIPNRPISTASSRKVLPFKYTKEDTVFNVSHSSLLTAAFMSEKWDILREAAQDRMHQYFRMKQMPELFEVQKVALKNGALMSTLSGSGSTFFNMCHASEAKRLNSILAKEFVRFQVLTLDFDNNGIMIEN